MNTFLVDNWLSLIYAGLLLLGSSLPLYLRAILIVKPRGLWPDLRDLWIYWSFRFALVFDLLGYIALILGLLGALIRSVP